MKAQLRAELLKLRSTRTALGLAAAMLALVAIAVSLHGYGAGKENLDTASKQLTLLVGWGAVLGGLFAGLLGALSFTGEVRHGTIRPTLLVTPRRGRVLAAKAMAAMVGGLGFGVAATSVGALAGSVFLGARGLNVELAAGDYLLLIAGGAVAGALWAAIGVGIGAVVRSQVPTVVGLLAWVLFVEGQLVDNVPAIGRFGPGAAGRAISGLNPDILLAPVLSALALGLYAVGAVAIGWRATTRRDFA